MLVVRYCDCVRTDRVSQIQLLGSNQISLASFIEWSTQPVIQASKSVSLKCIQCSATVGLSGLSSLVSCASSLLLYHSTSQSAKYSSKPCHLHIPMTLWPTSSFTSLKRCAFFTAEKSTLNFARHLLIYKL